MITYTCDEDVVGPWFMEKTGKQFFSYRTLGMLYEGRLVAAILCDRFGTYDCQVHIYSEPGVMWATTENCRAAFAFIFDLLDRRRITCETPVSNPRMIRMNHRLGMVQEGVKRKGADDGGDAIIFGMLREECNWIKGAP